MTNTDLVLGDKVMCTSYLHAVKDGVHISKDDSYYNYLKLNDKQFAENLPETDFFGGDRFLNWDENVEKTYFTKVSKLFRGVYVGRKNVVVKANFYVTSVYSGYEDIPQICKQPTQITTCALVYYGLGKSRLVPLDCLIKDGE